MEKPEQEDLNDVLSAIRNMVRDETRAKFPETAITDEENGPEPATPTGRQPNLPANVLILHPHMRVTKAKPKILLLDKASRVPNTAPSPVGESFAIASAAMDEGMLRDMVREVVQEQLRGELGKEIVGAIKRDMMQLLEKNN